MTYGNADYDLSGCVAVVTGGNGGIGAAIGARLAQCGAEVVSWDLARAADSPYRQDVVDVADAASVDAATQRLLARTGRIDFLINNAGYSGPTAPLA